MDCMKHQTQQQKYTDEEGVKVYTQRAKQGVLRNRVLLPPGLNVTCSDAQLNFAQPVRGERQGRTERGETTQLQGVRNLRLEW